MLDEYKLPNRSHHHARCTLVGEGRQDMVQHSQEPRHENTGKNQASLERGLNAGHEHHRLAENQKIRDDVRDTDKISPREL